MSTKVNTHRAWAIASKIEAVGKAIEEAIEGNPAFDGNDVATLLELIIWLAQEQQEVLDPGATREEAA